MIQPTLASVASPVSSAFETGNRAVGQAAPSSFREVCDRKEWLHWSCMACRSILFRQQLLLFVVNQQKRYCRIESTFWPGRCGSCRRISHARLRDGIQSSTEHDRKSAAPCRYVLFLRNMPCPLSPGDNRCATRHSL